MRSAPILFSAVADALQWIMANGVSWLIHYLDDFLTIGAPYNEECAKNKAVMSEVCGKAGLPLEPEKDEGPAMTLVFLGLEVDSEALLVRLPQAKLLQLKSLLLVWRGKKAGKKRELLSLIGVLGQAAKAVRSGRAFFRTLIDLSASVNQLDHFVRLNVDARSDIEWWYQFVEAWNGVSMMATVNRLHPHATVTSDASGTRGCGAFVAGEDCTVPIDPNFSRFNSKAEFVIIAPSFVWIISYKHTC